MNKPLPMGGQDVAVPGRKWTMHDVARLAEVSVKTVSRVLNNEPGVHETTRRRVLRVMENLGYEPHSGARSLRGHAPHCIGITAGAPSDDVPLSEELLGWLFRQLYDIFGVHGNYVCFDFNPYAPGKSGDYARGLWERLYRGLIITGPLAVNDTVMARIHASGSPYLALGRLASLPECSSAVADIAEGAYLATKHLIERGHRRIGLLMTLDGYTPGEERRLGYRRALDEAGLAYDADLIQPARFVSSSVTHGVHRLLMNTGVTALIDSSGSEDSISLREGFRRAGRVPGQDVEVVVWTYTYDAVVLAEAQAQVWLPVREAILAGLKEFAEWLAGDREGPISVVYRPILQFGAKGGEVKRPKLVFSTKE